MAQAALSICAPLVTPLSRRLWDIDWGADGVWNIDDDVTVENTRFADALPFIQEHYARIFGADEVGDRFVASPMTPAKRRFCDESDVFVFRSGAQTIGILIGHPTDWSTYYIRTAALLPDYRGRELVPKLLEILAAKLRAVGVERIQAETSPVNVSTMRLFLNVGFRVTATSLSERWGALVHTTWLLSDEADNVFHRQFCNYPKPKKNVRSRTP
jgi:ribosomal protein S18 acetylase RimI-like enzyme